MLPYICFYDAQGLATLIYEWRTMLFMRRNEGLVCYFYFIRPTFGDYYFLY